MRVTVSFAQCRARGLPDASFEVELSGLMGLPSHDAYLAGSGPPGGVAWFAVLPARGGGAAALEPALRARLGRVVELRDAGPLFIAGAPRPGLIAIGGEGHARALAFAALVVDATCCAEGLLLLGAWSANADTQPTLAAVLDVPALRALSTGFTLVAPELTSRPPTGFAPDLTRPLAGPPTGFAPDLARPLAGPPTGFAPHLTSPLAGPPTGFAPDLTSPLAGPPTGFAPDLARPLAGPPTGFAPDLARPLAGPPTGFTPDLASPLAGPPTGFTPDLASPLAGPPTGFAPDLTSPLAGPPTGFAAARPLAGPTGFAPPSAAPVADAWLELDGPGGQTRHPIVAAQVVLGRTGDVRIDDPRVSRQHALIERRLDGFVLQVLSTAHGVEVAGALRAHGTFPLVDGATFMMGDTRARFVATAGRAPRSPFLRVAQLDAFFSGLGLPPPPVPVALAVVATDDAVASDAPHGPQLAITWSPGHFSYRWASRSWSVVLDSASFGGAARPDARRVADTFRALGAVVADAMMHEGTLAPPGHVPRMEVVATSAAHAVWRTPFGVEYLATDAHGALLEALTWRRANRL